MVATVAPGPTSPGADRQSGTGHWRRLRSYDIVSGGALVVGAALRWQQPDLVLFKFDEATAAGQVMTMIRTATPAAAGTQSSVGGLFPPLFDDLMLPPFLVHPSPVLATSYVAALNVLAVALATVMMRRYAGARAAAMVALLYALSPWAVVYSRKIWDPYVIAPFAVLALWGLLALALEGRAWGGALAVGCWLWLVQLHPSAALLAPVGIIALWRWRRGLRLPSLAVGVVVGLAPLLPYLRYERDHRWEDVLKFLRAGEGTSHLSGDALLYPLQNATGLAATQLQDVPFAQFLRVAWLQPVLAGAGVVVIVVGLGAATWRGLTLWQRRSAPRWGSEDVASGRLALYALPVCWLAVPTILAFRESTPMFPHYFMELLPVTFIAVALGLDALGDRWPAGAPTVVVGTALYAIAAATPLVALLRYLPTSPAAGFQYVRYTAAVEQAVDRVAPNDPVDLVGLGSDAAAAIVFLAQQRHAVAATNTSWALLANAPTQALIGPSSGAISDDLQPAPTFPQAATIVAGADAIQVVPLYGGGQPAALRGMRPLSDRLVNGVQYLGWTVRQPNPRLLRVTLGWRVGAAPAGGYGLDLAPYVHLMQGTTLVAQHDGVAYPSGRWRAGQVIYAWFDLPLPATLGAGEFELRTGMYTRPAVRRVPRLGPTGPDDGEFALSAIHLPLRGEERVR